MSRVLQFRDLERDTSSYHRAERAGAIIRRYGPYWFEVTLLDRDNPTSYTVDLYRESGAWHGECDCPAHRYHKPPCAHIWAIKRAHEHVEGVALHHVEDAFSRTTDCPTCGQPRTEVDHAKA